MTTLTLPVQTTTTSRPVAATLAVVGGALAANGLLLGSQLFLDARAYSEAAGSWVHLAHYVVWTGCLVALSQLYPRLRGLPGPVLALAGVGVALDACARFVSAFVTPYLADHQPALVDDAPDPILLVPLLATGIVAMAGTVALAVAAWRRRLAPRAALVLMLLGGLAIPAIGPLSNVLLGAGLVWWGLALRARA
jgi:hypothetical protein